MIKLKLILDKPLNIIDKNYIEYMYGDDAYSATHYIFAHIKPKYIYFSIMQ
jgi:hypothetical protein